MVHFCTKHFFCSNKKKDTCNIIEKILILEVSLLSNLIDGFQEKGLSPRPLLLKQHDHVPQRHVVSAVCEGSQLQDTERRESRGDLTHTRYHFPQNAVTGKCVTKVTSQKGQQKSSLPGKCHRCRRGGARSQNPAPRHPREPPGGSGTRRVGPRL